LLAKVENFDGLQGDVKKRIGGQGVKVRAGYFRVEETRLPLRERGTKSYAMKKGPGVLHPMDQIADRRFRLKEERMAE